MAYSVFLIVVCDVADKGCTSKSTEDHNNQHQSGQVDPVFHPRPEVLVDAECALDKEEIETSFLSQVKDHGEEDCCSARTRGINRMSKVQQTSGDAKGIFKEVDYYGENMRHSQVEQGMGLPDRIQTY